MSAAAPTLDRFYPPGLARGTTAEIAAEGKFEVWPAQVWCESPGIRVEFLEEKNRIRVHAADSTACGIHWLRFYDQEGVTAAKPLVVGTCPEVLEAEPNEQLGKAQLIQLPATVNGRLDKRGDVDVYGVELEAGQRLVVSLGAHLEIGSPMDGILQIVGPGGHVLEQNDDARGLDAMLVFNVPATGKYFIRAFGFPATPTQAIQFAGGKEFVYRLSATTDGFLDHTLPLAASSAGSTSLRLFGWNIPDECVQLSLAAEASADCLSAFHPQLMATATLPVTAAANLVALDECSPAHPQLVQLPSMISGRVDAVNDVDVFHLTGMKGQKLVARVEASVFGSLLDPQLILLDSTGKTLVEVDDANRQERDCVLSHTLPEDGDYFLHLSDVHDHGGFRYYYRLLVEEAKPEFKLTVAADSFVLDPSKDEPLEIAIAIERRNGFDQPIEITAIGLPDSVRCAPLVSEPKGDSSKTVKLKLTATKKDEKSSGQFQLHGTSRGEDALQDRATYSIPLPATTFDRLWLTVK